MLGIALCLAAPIIYIVQFQMLQRLFMPWYAQFMPWYAAVLSTVGVALMLYAVTRRAGVIRIIFLGLFALLCAFEWLFLVVLTKLPAYEGPARAGEGARPRTLARGGGSPTPLPSRRGSPRRRGSPPGDA